MQPTDLPEWWTSSELFAFLDANELIVPGWTWGFATLLLIATQLQFRKLHVAGPVRPIVVTATLLAAQGLFMLAGIGATDRGMMFHYGSATWGVIVLAYAWLMWAWRIQCRRSGQDDKRFANLPVAKLSERAT